MDIAIVEDMMMDSQNLDVLLRKYAAIHGLEIEYHHFSSAEDLIREYRPMRYAIIFLDIFLAKMTGIEAAQKIRMMDDDVVLIFVSTSHEFVAEAMSSFATAYIMKPCTEKELFRTMDHILKLKTETEVKRLTFITQKKQYSLKITDIIALMSKGNYLDVTDTKGTTYRTRMTLVSALESLDTRFLQVLKGVIVNLDYVVDMTDDQCLLSNGQRYPINVRKHREIRQIWQNYMFTRTRNEVGFEGVRIC